MNVKLSGVKRLSLLNGKQAAALIGVSRQTFYDYVAAGKITARSLPGTTRPHYDEAELLALKSGRAPEPTPPPPVRATGNTQLELLSLDQAAGEKIVDEDRLRMAAKLVEPYRLRLERPRLRLIAGGAPFNTDEDRELARQQYIQLRAQVLDWEISGAHPAALEEAYAELGRLAVKLGLVPGPSRPGPGESEPVPAGSPEECPRRDSNPSVARFRELTEAA